MGSSRQEYWSALPFPSPGDLPDARIEPGSRALEADALTSEPPQGGWAHSEQRRASKPAVTATAPPVSLTGTLGLPKGPSSLFP